MLPRFFSQNTPPLHCSSSSTASPSPSVASFPLHLLFAATPSSSVAFTVPLHLLFAATLRRGTIKPNLDILFLLVFYSNQPASYIFCSSILRPITEHIGVADNSDQEIKIEKACSQVILHSMIRVLNHPKKSSFKNVVCARIYCSSEINKEVLDPAKQICKIMMSCPKLGVATALDQSGFRPSSEVVEEVLKRLGNAGMLVYQFFEWAGKQRNYEHSVRAYHAMVESLAKIRQYEIMWDLINSMRSKGLLNIETFCIIMRKYARAQKVEEAIYTFNVMEKYNIPPNLAAFNGLLSALCKSRNVRKAQEIFNSMKDRFVPDQKTYSILIEGWGREPNLPKAREIYNEMVNDGCRPDIVTYGIMVDILCKAGRIEEAIDIIKDMECSGCRPTSFIYSILVHTYGIENRIEDAVDTFLEMERNNVRADVAVYNALISAFCKVNKLRNAYRVLNEMECKGVKPNSRTCNILLNYLIERKETVEAFKVFRRMIKICEPDADTYTIMIKMFCETGDIEMALKVWKYMKLKQFVPSLHTFSVLINGLCENEDASHACILMEEMIEKGIRPPRLTFGRLRKLLIEQRRDNVFEFLQQKLNLLVKEPLCD